MKQNRSIAVVAASAILFGIVSKWLVGLPYMVWGILTFLLSCHSFCGRCIRLLYIWQGK